ncbi:MAG: hypothetical protein ABIH26_14185 [Candidatus Eisenbacteria bacterium]
MSIENAPGLCGNPDLREADTRRQPSPYGQAASIIGLRIAGLEQDRALLHRAEQDRLRERRIEEILDRELGDDWGPRP